MLLDVAVLRLRACLLSTAVIIANLSPLKLSLFQ
jgi:hypothetical protein